MTKNILISAAVGAAVGVAAALIFAPSPTGLLWTVTVQATEPQLSLNPVELSKSRKDVVTWRAKPTSKYLVVEYDQKIFANAIAQPNGRYRSSCVLNVCDSGAILGTLPTSPPDGYQYWYSLSDSTTSGPWGNGRIIINP